ncbi:MAG TPA: hypothetical protein PKD12_11735 [Nitrospira sp.]|nr:hypothetical protein [Nitrospira sp.]
MTSRVQAHGRQKSSGREILSLAVPYIERLPQSLGSNSQHCVLFLAADATSLADDKLFSLVNWVVDQGAVYVCVWGPGCERVHDVIDETIVEASVKLGQMETDETIIITTWYDDESLEEALWFVLNNAIPASAYFESCSAVVAVSIGNEQWGTRISAYFSDPERLS